ncbi:uncharacterized protein LOC118464508 [Anopheles albimanus]|uniref:uncharacterized protein LOC118464508 n=1 Tax=Anopheles albimanus TaxID=7167 RepID=UPI00163DE67A|nr:uncharacterized protein LOC118464508 [Anopheles albimanus]
MVTTVTKESRHGLNDDETVRRPRTTNSGSMRLGSWNVRTLQRAGALNQLDDELAKLNMDLVALQEIRWLGSGVRNIRGSTRYDIYYSCHAEHHILGTGFAVGQRLKSDIIGFRAIDERLCTLRLRGRFSNISLINVHAPTEDKTEEEKDLYYGRLLRAIDQCPKYDVKIILGDFNAKIGRDPVYRQYTGLHSLHEHSNDNGSRLINFAIANDLVIGSTKFARRDIHKATWVSPNGATSNQIDHVLINRRRQSSLLNVRTYRGAKVGSDHYLVGLEIRGRIACTRETGKNNTQTRYNTASLKDNNVQAAYEEAIRDGLLSTQESNTSGRWPALKTCIISCAENILGRRRGNTRSDWFDEECRLVTERKNCAYQEAQQRHRTRASKGNYERLRKEEKKLHRIKKRKWEENRIRELEENRVRYGPTRQFYQAIAGYRKTAAPKVSCCRSKNGDVISNQPEVLSRWAQHFDELLNDQLHDTPEAPLVDMNLLLPPSLEETRRPSVG